MANDSEFMGLPMTVASIDAKVEERQFWGKLRRVVARLPFAQDLVAAYYCAIDQQTPAYVRGVLLGAIAYFILPADLVPDILAGVGFTDDASVLAAAIAAVGSNIQPEHRARARDRLAEFAA